MAVVCIAGKVLWEEYIERQRDVSFTFADGSLFRHLLYFTFTSFWANRIRFHLDLFPAYTGVTVTTTIHLSRV